MSGKQQATRNIGFDNKHFLDKYFDSITEGSDLKAQQWLDQQAELGFLPTTLDEQERLVNKLINRMESPLKSEWLNTAHPSRFSDLGMVYSAFNMLSYKGFVEIVRLVLSGNFLINDIELFLVLLASRKELRDEYPELTSSVDSLGAGGMFTILLPFIHYIRNDAVFSFTTETSHEIATLDIAKGVDSFYLRSPFSSCYFHLTDSDHEVHCTESGMHQLEGFYISETTDHSFYIAKGTLIKLGIDPEKPYRYVNLTFVGKPKLNIGNDTMAKFDLFLQEGVPIDVLIENTIKWYNAELESDFEMAEVTKLGTFENKTQVYNFESQVEHNVNLIRVAVNHLAYLSFANYRKENYQPRKTILDNINKKSPQNKKKAAKKLLGKSDVIIISTTSLFASVYHTGEVAGKKSSHLRRGFVRNQCYGSADNRTHKPIYIAPTLVGLSSDDTMPPKNYTIKK